MEDTNENKNQTNPSKKRRGMGVCYIFGVN